MGPHTTYNCRLTSVEALYLIMAIRENLAMMQEAEEPPGRVQMVKQLLHKLQHLTKLDMDDIFT